MHTPKRGRGNPHGAPVNDAKWERLVRAKSRDRKSKANRTDTRQKKRNRTKSRAIDYRLLVPERQLKHSEIPAAKMIVLEQICDHGAPSKACLAAGIGRRTFYQWLHEDDGVFAKEYVEARRIWRASMVGDVEAAFGDRAQFKDTLAGIFVLKHNTKRYREVSRVQLSGPDGGPIVTLDAKELLIQKLAKMIERAGSKPALVAGSVEVHEHEGSRGLEIVKGSRGPDKVRKARGVSYG